MTRQNADEELQSSNAPLLSSPCDGRASVAQKATSLVEEERQVGMRRRQFISFEKCFAPTLTDERGKLNILFYYILLNS